MNERSGLCVPKDGSFLGEWGTGIGAGRYRFTGDIDNGMPREYADLYVQAGLKLTLTYDSDTFTGRSDEEAVAGLAEKYGGLIDIVEVGNEADGKGAESSNMTHARINRLMEISRYYWGDAQLLSCPGLITGDPNWLDQFDFTHCNLINIHPYGQWAPRAYQGVGPFNGLLPDIMKRYVDKARNLSGRFIPLIITEFGLSTHEVSEETQAHYIGSAVDYLLQRPDILVCHHVFAFHDHAGFGILRPDGSWKPSCYAYINAVNGLWPRRARAIKASMQQGPLDAVRQWQGGIQALPPMRELESGSDVWMTEGSEGLIHTD